MRLRNPFRPSRPAVGTTNESERERWLEATLKSIPRGCTILDAGAGTQRYRKYCGHLNYVSQDFGQYDGKGDASGLQTGDFDYGKLDIVSDINAIPAPSSSFDAIMCVEVLEHLANPVHAIREFSRLIKPGGYLVITAPFCSLTHLSPYHFSTGFNRYWYLHHLKASNFDISEITANGNFFEYLAQELHRTGTVSKRYTRSKPNLLEKLCISITLRMLSRFSRQDNGSSEILCYGYNVLARKL